MIRVKFLSKNPIPEFQFAAKSSQHNDVIFELNPKSRDYDWLVVYDDLAPLKNERFAMSQEELACPAQNTMLLTYEPSSIKLYGKDYTHQFGVVMTSHEEHILKHPNRFFMPPVGFWYYGDADDCTNTPTIKHKDLSIFMSAKADKHTMHALRYNFLCDIRDHFGDRADIFGKGERFLEKKCEGLDHYRYTLALENHLSPHHWTEKLSDAFIGYTMPLYAGCSNVSDYFPEDSFIQLDMRDSKAAIDIIEKTIADNRYEDCLPAIIEARRRVLDDYNLPNYIAGAIKKNTSSYVPQNKGHILSRRLKRVQNPANMLRYGWEKVQNRYYFSRQNRDYRGYL